MHNVLFFGGAGGLEVSTVDTVKEKPHIALLFLRMFVAFGGKKAPGVLIGKRYALFANCKPGRISEDDFDDDRQPKIAKW